MITNTGSATVITGKQDINLFALLTMQSALKLEAVGLKRRGPSMLSIVKRRYNLKGSRQSVAAQFDEIVTKAKADRDPNQ